MHCSMAVEEFTRKKIKILCSKISQVVVMSVFNPDWLAELFMCSSILYPPTDEQSTLQIFYKYKDAVIIMNLFK